MDVLFGTVRELAGAIATRRVSCREVVQAHLDRIHAVNGAINAMMHVAREEALTEADLRDREIRHGAVRGPLHGVPFTVKDCFATSDMPTTCGVEAWVGFRQRRDAAVVARLRASGAILVGKTSLPPFLSSFETVNGVIGRTSNPYDRDRSSGGSSGGEAAIVCAGGSAFGVGSDRGGSIRVPCAYCGVAGLKPTAGTISSLGHLLLPIGPLKADPGPISRRIDDLSLVLDILTPVRPPPDEQNGPLSIAWYGRCDGAEPDPPVRDTLARAVVLLRDNGHEVKHVEPPGLDIARDLVMALSSVHNEVFGREVIPEFFEPRDRTPEEASLLAESWVERSRAWAHKTAMSGFEYFAQEMRLDVLRARMEVFMESFDAILCPVTGSTALPHGSRTRTNTFLYSLTGNPAVSVPAGLDSSGLPVGLQVVGRRWEDRKVLRIASRIESGLGGWVNPPV